MNQTQPFKSVTLLRIKQQTQPLTNSSSQVKFYSKALRQLKWQRNTSRERKIENIYCSGLAQWLNMAQYTSESRETQNTRPNQWEQRREFFPFCLSEGRTWLVSLEAN